MDTPPVEPRAYDYGTLEQVSPLTRLLWSCAGADEQILVQCPNSDRVKYQGLGGIVLATGVLAFLSGSYAFYMVFSPKVDTALGEGQAAQWPSVAVALLCGVVWSAIIFNMERFIVSSSGKGDGTDRITWSELVSALPRIVMGIIIGLTLSAPLELRILQSEIDAELQKEQREYRDDLDSSDRAGHDLKKAELTGNIAEAQARLDAIDADLEMRRLEINDQRQKLEQEADGLSGSGRPGRGPAYLDKRANLDVKEAELKADKAKAVDRAKSLTSDVEAWKATVASGDGALSERQLQNERQSHNLDGLSKRILISHKVGGKVPIMIALLLMCIELGPIFFKMMVTKGVYEVLEENQKLLVRAHAGIEEDGHMFTDSAGAAHHHHRPRFHAYDTVVEELRRRAQTEQELAELAHTEYRRVVGDEIRAAPRRFIAEEPALRDAAGRGPGRPTPPRAPLSGAPRADSRYEGGRVSPETGAPPADRAGTDAPAEAEADSPGTRGQRLT